ncbi:CAP domain-containing protein [Crucibulum laeve]|uniref:CAP domain-containing protein n=1 Tax=Crucibulum laeve TaxID=68775 RepID=A0A5C3M8H2_9AGAR|nr:CAP domain-containing protein [Crucibulum laeve]
MAPLLSVVSLAFALTNISGAFAGPACAKKHYQAANCIQLCNSRWGWAGSAMGTNPWGSVMQKTGDTESLEDILTKACGSTVASSSTQATGSPIANVASEINTASIAAVLSSATASVTNVASSSVVSSISVAPSVSSVSSVSASAAVSFAASFSAPAFAPIIPSKASPASSVRATPSTTQAPVPATTSTTTRATPVTTSTKAPAAATTQAQESNVGGATSNSDIQAYLAGHNSIRAQHGASPLTWSDNLASKAQQWANGCQFHHSGGSLGAFGENLAAGTGGSYGIASAIKSWTDEVSQYNPNSPQPSHFTQVVWKGTTQVGCALQLCDGIFAASFGKAKYYVCEYSAQGNIIGEFAENIQI